MSVLERDIETAVVRYAKQQDCLVRKMNGLGARNWPDRMFITPKGDVFFVEFKAPNKTLEKGSAQELFYMELQKRNVSVYVCNDVGRGKAIVDAECSR